MSVATSINQRALRRAAAGVVLVGGALLGVAPVQAHPSVPAVPDPGSAVSAVGVLEACPVAGPSEFGDSWGDPRSSGRRHEGVDIAAERGTPVVAVRDGDAEFKRNGLGGNAIWLVAATGERFYYAHLDRWEGESRPVRAGEILGYVGSTGNAAGNHLHFETRAGGDAVNPYPYVEVACGAPLGWSHDFFSVRPLLR